MNLLEHSLTQYFDQLAAANSSSELAELPLYAKLQTQIDEILEYVLQANVGPAPITYKKTIRATAWNIERGIESEAIKGVLLDHPILNRSDILILTELDYGMARSGNRKIACDLGVDLGYNYAFAPSYINLEKGSGLESQTHGTNDYGVHGNAVFSRFPIGEVRSIALPNGKDKMRGREKRLGCQRAVAAIVHHPDGPLRIVSAHLDAHSTQKHRMHQMRLILDQLDQFHPELPALIGGDWNTSTFNSRNAFLTIMGYWRRIMMGVRYVIQNHYPHPDRWFERHLFRELESRGYNYRDLNEPGGCTLHYDVKDLAANGRMADWIPNWCFWFINWALENNDGRCSLKLDWFAGKGIKPSETFPPQVVNDVHGQARPLSDHDPIVLDFSLERSKSRE